ncbi:MAG: DUF4367 domain-containing protein [Oscillospiraceae bacterium]
MSEEMLAKALAEVCGSELRSLPQCNDIPDDYEFSQAFEDKMRETLGAERTIIVKKTAISKRIKVGLLIAVIFSAGFLLGMAKEPIWNFITQKVDGGMQLSFDVSTVEDPETRINEVYTISGALDDYGLIDSAQSDISLWEIWIKQKEGADHADGMVYFGQYIASAYTDAFVSDDCKNEYYISEDGTQYYISSNENYTSVVWYNGDYVLLLSGGLNKDEMLDLCKSVKIKER